MTGRLITENAAPIEDTGLFYSRCLHPKQLGQIFKATRATLHIAHTHWFTGEDTFEWGPPYFEVSTARAWCADCNKLLGEKEIARMEVLR